MGIGQGIKKMIKKRMNDWKGPVKGRGNNNSSGINTDDDTFAINI